MLPRTISMFSLESLIFVPMRTRTKLRLEDIEAIVVVSKTTEI